MLLERTILLECIKDGRSRGKATFAERFLCREIAAIGINDNKLLFEKK